jgi:hypothetical protein
MAEVPEWGTIRGQIFVSGVPPQLPPKANAEGLCPALDVPDDSLIIDPVTGGLSYAVVYLRQQPVLVHPDLAPVPHRPVQQVIKDCRFTPHVVFVRTGQPLDILLSDPIPHHVRAVGFTNQLVGGEQITPDSVRFQLAQPERLPMRVQCDLHGYMEGWWLVLDHPYGAVTDAEGKFELPQLPVGKHELTIWHEHAGYLEKTLQIHVRSGIQDLPPLTYPLEQFQRDSP